MVWNRDVVVEEVVDGRQGVRLVKSLHEVVTEDGMRLVVTAKRPADPDDGLEERAPVLLVHGLGQNRYSWHLSGRSFENFLVSRGYRTFNLELRGHGLSHTAGSRHPRDVEEYVRHDVPAGVALARQVTGCDSVIYVGHSLGGLIGYWSTPETLGQLAGMVSFAGPFFFGQGNLPLRLAARLGKTPLNLSLIRLIPTLPLPIDRVGLAVRGTLPFWDFPYNGFPLQVWHPRSIEKHLLRERIREGFDRTSFNVLREMTTWAAEGRFTSDDRRIDPDTRLAQLRVPLLCIAGDKDSAVPLGSIEPGFRRAGSPDKTLRTYGKDTDGIHFGHCDLICGRAAPSVVWPEVARWLDDRSAC